MNKPFLGSPGRLLSQLSQDQLRLVHPKAHFRRVFEITGMARDFEVVEKA